MNSNSLVAFLAATFSGTLAAALIIRRRHSIASWCFIAGIGTLALESALSGLSMQTELPANVDYWQTLALVMGSLMPGLWLCFSLTYSRGNYAEFLVKWRFVLIVVFLLPIGLSLGFWNELIAVLPLTAPAHGWWLKIGMPAKALHVLLLIATVLVLVNLEGTFRSAVGMMRWRIKFVILGLGVVFAARIYTRSQALLFSGNTLDLTVVDSCGLLIGCAMIAVAYARGGLANIVDVYPSRAVLQSSVTVILVGAYLTIVGVLAQVIGEFGGGAASFPAQAFVLLLAVALLGVLLLSDRLRQRTRRFVSLHLRRPEHDYRKVWTEFTRGLSNVANESDLCAAAAKSISNTFDVLSVTIWLVDDQKDRLVLGATTSQFRRAAAETATGLAECSSILGGLRKHLEPFDLEKTKEDWGGALREACPTQFPHGGNRLAVPLVAGNRHLGCAVLADRVNGLRYSAEEADLLKCIGEQVAASILNLRLTKELMAGKELEAFQTMSAFFVHDLKNAASSLSLMLQNLPVHFNDPTFREDALRGIAATVGRINHLIERLSALRRKLEVSPVESDLNQLVAETLNSLNGMPGVEFVQDLHHLPNFPADRELLQSVITNLLLNAGDAVGSAGRITIQTQQRDGLAILSVSDTGCGMSAAFMTDSLFRPFQTTKKKGLGIGMFQSKMIVEAHRGSIQVESESGKGTTFRVFLPLQPEAL